MIQSDELRNALMKVKSFIPTERAKEIELKVNQIYIDFSQWIGNSNIQSYIEIIKVALQENKLLSFDYIAHRGNKTTRVVEPYQLVLKVRIGIYMDIAIKETIFAYSDCRVCQPYKTKRNFYTTRLSKTKIRVCRCFSNPTNKN